MEIEDPKWMHIGEDSPYDKVVTIGFRWQELGEDQVGTVCVPETLKREDPFNCGRERGGKILRWY